MVGIRSAEGLALIRLTQSTATTNFERTAGAQPLLRGVFRRVDVERLIMQRKVYDTIEKELDKIDSYIFNHSKDEFMSDGLLFYSYGREEEDVDMDGDTIFTGQALCPEEIEINEEYEDELEYRIPSYNYIRDDLGFVVSCEFDLNYEWKPSGIFWGKKKVV